MAVKLYRYKKITQICQTNPHIHWLNGRLMQWSVELRSTRYRGTHDEEGRGYITFDKEVIWSMCTLTFFSMEYERIKEIANREKVSPSKAQNIAHDELASEGVFHQYTYYDSLDECCNNSIGSSLSSENLLIRCLAMLDTRVGKRRLTAYDLSQEAEKVIQFLRIRCRCEGWSIPTYPSN